MPALSRLLDGRAKSAPVGSYTHRLLNDPVLLASKLREEAGELIEASAQNDRAEVAAEAADVIYFTLVHLAKHGVSLAEVERVLDARHYKVTRRKGDAKPGNAIAAIALAVPFSADVCSAGSSSTSRATRSGARARSASAIAPP